MPKIPPEFIKPGLVWGDGDPSTIYVYAETKKHLAGIPDEIDGVKVVKRVVGKVRPAGG